MDFEHILKSLHPLEVKLLRAFLPGETMSVPVVIHKLNFNIGQCNQAFSWLSAKELIAEASREQRTLYELTETGDKTREIGTPEERILALLKEKGPKKLPEIAGELNLENKDVGSSFGQMAKEGLLTMDGEKKVGIKDDSRTDRIKLVRSLIEKASKQGTLADTDLTPDEQQAISGISKKRGAASSIFKAVEREEISYVFADAGARLREQLIERGITGEEIGQLTQELLAEGGWRDKKFRPYNINIPPSRVLLGRKNPYCEYLETVKDKLASLGFEEFDGPLVETEFWNSDALFMPQFHAARDIHDVYHLEHPEYAKEIEQPHLDQVAETHEDGWNTGSRGWKYDFDRKFTRRLILRSQGTVLSAKALTRAKVPGKYFGIVRCFRYDQVDATHLSDFYQTEGIILGEEVNLKNLLGLLKMFAEELAGANEVKYVPGYFPFTEPSVEVHIKHPVLGWFELGGSGIFRPEVTRPLGIDVPVLAWGLGIDRMALMHLGLDDLRELFSPDIENVRLRRRS
jgi:phenylalanyl-tRNA synthetase alpha chain